MAPNKAMAKAGPTSCSRSETGSAGQEKPGSARGMPPNALPMVATPGNCQIACAPIATSIATSGAGTRFSPGTSDEPAIARDQDRQRQRGDQRGGDVHFRQGAQHRDEFFVEVQAGSGGVQAEEILPLAGPDDHGDARGEPDDDRARDELDDAAEAREPHDQQDAAGHHGGGLQAGDAVLRGDAGEHRDEGAGGPGDLHARATGNRGDETGDDGGVQPLRRCRARGDGKGHGERHGDDAHDHARDDVGHEVGALQQSGPVRFEQGDHGARLSGHSYICPVWGGLLSCSVWQRNPPAP